MDFQKETNHKESVAVLVLLAHNPHERVGVLAGSLLARKHHFSSARGRGTHKKAHKSLSILCLCPLRIINDYCLSIYMLNLLTSLYTTPPASFYIYFILHLA